MQLRTIQRDIVGAFIFSNDNQLLLGKNGSGGVYQDLWVIPGGGIDEGETKLEAVKREVMEEVGIDISSAKIELVDMVLTGQSEKTLKETGETVLVDMTFYNYKIDFNMPAKELLVSLNDDLGEAAWTPIGQLAGKSYSPSVKAILKHLNCLE